MEHGRNLFPLPHMKKTKLQVTDHAEMIYNEFLKSHFIKSEIVFSNTVTENTKIALQIHARSL